MTEKPNYCDFTQRWLPSKADLLAKGWVKTAQGWIDPYYHDKRLDKPNKPNK